MIISKATALLASAIFVVPVSAADPPPDGPRSQVAALGQELERHPDATASDVYKFLYQGVFGPGHAVEDRQAAARALDEEIAALAPAAVEEQLCQPLGGANPMVRIHLRPYLAAGNDPSALVDAFVASAAGETGGAADMDAAVEAAVASLAKRGLWSLGGELQELGQKLASEGYPASHHSPRYLELYRPAYRIVRLDLARANGWCP